MCSSGSKPGVGDKQPREKSCDARSSDTHTYLLGAHTVQHLNTQARSTSVWALVIQAATMTTAHLKVKRLRAMTCLAVMAQHVGQHLTFCLTQPAAWFQWLVLECVL